MRRIGQDKGQRLIGMADALSASGITKLVLHAWERRYGLEPAERSPSGRRFYTSEQVERLRLLKTCTDGGYRIGNLVGLPTEALSRIEADLNARNALSEILEAVKAMDSDRLQALLLARAEEDMPEQFIRATALPLMREVGSLWASGEASIAAEHMTTAQIKRILGSLFDQCPPVASDAPRLSRRRRSRKSTISALSSPRFLHGCAAGMRCFSAPICRPARLPTPPVAAKCIVSVSAR